MNNRLNNQKSFTKLLFLACLSLNFLPFRQGEIPLFNIWPRFSKGNGMIVEKVDSKPFINASMVYERQEAGTQPILQLTFTDQFEMNGVYYEGIFGVNIGCLEDDIPCFSLPELILKVPVEQGLYFDYGSISSYDWSPDGKNLVAEIDNDILLFNIESGEQRTLTNASTNDFSPYWSPNGHEIIYYSCIIDPKPSCGVFQIDEFGGNGKQLLIKSTSSPSYAKWTPDGKQLIYREQESSGSYQLWIANPDGSEAVKLTRDYAEYISYYAMLPDLKSIFFQQTDNKGFNFFLTDRNGSTTSKLIHNFNQNHILSSIDPSGHWVAFSYSNSFSGESQIYLFSMEERKSLLMFEVKNSYSELNWRRVEK